MLITYCGTLHILLLCCHPAASFTGVSTSISKALSTQQKSIRQKDSISCKYYQHRYFATAISSLSKEQSVNDRNASYTGLLVHYLTQNVKPKFYLCVNIISKIIKHDGPDSAIRIGELLENRISADSLRMTKNALLSALVLQKQTEPASSLLRQLLLQQNGHWQLDIAVVADLLQLYMAIDTDRDTTIMRRQYKKRALQASMIYANVIDVQAQSQYPISQSQMLKRNFTQERSRRSSELQLTSTSVAASDRIHEYGARALAVSRDWDEAVRAVACIGDTHLATPSLIIFNSELLERLVKLDVVSLQAPEAVTVGVDSALAKTTSSCRKTAVDSRTISLATELAMLQPLHLLATDCPMLQSSLLLLGTSSMHADRLIASLQDISDRGSGALPLFSPNTDLAASGNLLLPSRVSSMLLERMFLSGYRFYELAEAVRIIWGQNGNGSDSENSIYSTISEETAVSHTSEDKSLISPILKAVNGILRIACSIRDKRAEELKNDRNGTSQVPFDSDVTALIPIIGDALSCSALSSTCPRAELGFARALNPCLHLLFLSFQQTDMSSTRRSASVSQISSLTSNILQAIMDETWTTSSWYPDTDLLADALQLPFPVLFPFQIIQDTSETRQLAVHEEVIAQVRRGDIPEAFVLFALFR